MTVYFVIFMKKVNSAIQVIFSLQHTMSKSEVVALTTQ